MSKPSTQETLLFEEIQNYRRSWVLFVLLLIDITLFSIYYFQFHKENSWTLFNEESLAALCLLASVLSILLVMVNLHTRITAKGLYVQFFPFHFSTRYYSWEQMQDIYIREYNPLKEFGGWGYRISIFGKGTAYNLGGHTGIQIILKNQKKLLLGTRKAAEIHELLYKLKQGNDRS